VLALDVLFRGLGCPLNLLRGAFLNHCTRWHLLQPPRQPTRVSLTRRWLIEEVQKGGDDDEEDERNPISSAKTGERRRRGRAGLNPQRCGRMPPTQLGVRRAGGWHGPARRWRGQSKRGEERAQEARDGVRGQGARCRGVMPPPGHDETRGGVELDRELVPLRSLRHRGMRRTPIVATPEHLHAPQA